MNFHTNWSIWSSDDFVVGKLVLPANSYAPVVSVVPPKAVFVEDNLGINLFRCNAFVQGRFELRSSMVPWLTKSRGDGSEEQRIAVNGNFLFKGLDEGDNVFYCVSAAEGNENLYWSRNHPLAPGESCTIEDRALQRYAFVLEGTVTCNGVEHSEYKKLTLIQPQAYTFTNNTDSLAYVMFVYVISVAEARALLDYVPVEQLDAVLCLRLE